MSVYRLVVITRKYNDYTFCTDQRPKVIRRKDEDYTFFTLALTTVYDKGQ